MTTDESTPAGRYLDAFTSGQFRTLFSAMILSTLGSVVVTLAIVVLVYDRTSSPLLSALTFTTMFVPYLLGGTLLSGLVDRLPARRLMVGCDAAGAVVVGAMAIPSIPVPMLFVLLFVLSMLTPLSLGTRSGLLPVILPAGAVVPARSLFRLVSQSSQVIGFAVGGALLAVLSPRSALIAAAVTYAASALTLRVFMGAYPRSERRDRAGHRGSLAGDSLRGVGTVLGDPARRRVLLLGWVVPMLAVVPEALGAPSVTLRGLPASDSGWWLMAAPLGTFAGEIAGVWLIPAARRGAFTKPLAAALFVPFLFFALHPSLIPALVLLVVGGLCGVYLLGVDQLLLDATPEELLGRTYTVNSAVLMTTQGIGFAGAGAIAEFASPDYVIAVAGLAGLATVASLRMPHRPREVSPARPAGNAAAPDQDRAAS